MLSDLGVTDGEMEVISARSHSSSQCPQDSGERRAVTVGLPAGIRQSNAELIVSSNSAPSPKASHSQSRPRPRLRPMSSGPSRL